MFGIARDDVLRIAVYVPQGSAIGIRDGVGARATVPEIPGRVFKGRVARSSVALPGGEGLILSPPACLAEGGKVQVANPLASPDGGRQTASR